MPFNFQNLDARTRDLMAHEVDRDIAEGSLYESVRLTAAGAASWEGLFRDACAAGDDASLAVALGAPGGPNIEAREPNTRSRTGDDKAVPYTAATTMAEGEFNRFYIRALCMRAIEDGSALEIYRARPSENPDPDSEAKVGQVVDPATLLNDLRSHQGVATAFGLPPHPNSGLSVRLRP
jgi:hypothetical protein